MKIFNLIVLMLLSFSVQAQDEIWVTFDETNGKEKSLAVSAYGTCMVFRYYDDIGLADNIPKPLSKAQFKYEWRAGNPSEQDVCARTTEAAQTIKVKILKAAPSPNGTRRTRDITATDYTTTRIPDSSLCTGGIIKKYQTNKNWHKVTGLNLTTLCGEY